MLTVVVRLHLLPLHCCGDRNQMLKDEKEAQKQALSQAKREIEEKRKQAHKEIKAAKEEVEKKEAEFEFVVQSRAELVRLIWELYGQVSSSAAVLPAFPLALAFRLGLCSPRWC